MSNLLMNNFLCIYVLFDNYVFDFHEEMVKYIFYHNFLLYLYRNNHQHNNVLLHIHACYPDVHIFYYKFFYNHFYLLIHILFYNNVVFDNYVLDFHEDMVMYISHHILLLYLYRSNHQHNNEFLHIHACYPDDHIFFYKLFYNLFYLLIHILLYNNVVFDNYVLYFHEDIVKYNSHHILLLFHLMNISLYNNE